MALGDSNGYSGGNNNKPFDNTFYSRIKFKNKDKRSVGFSFTKGLLCISISEEKDGYKYDELSTINLSPMKAMLLMNHLKSFVADIDSYAEDPNKAIGVNAGIKETVSFIAFHCTGKRSTSGYPETAMSIGKVDQDGKVHDVAEFVFNMDYHNSLEWSNLGTMEVGKRVSDSAELDMFIVVLNEFVNTSSGSTGYSVFDIGRYQIKRISDPIYEKLGIERYGGSGQRSSANNYFSGNAMNAPVGNGRQSTSRSYDEIEDMLQ